MKYLNLLIVLILCSSVSANENIEVSISDLKSNQARFRGKKVLLTGRIQFTGKRITKQTKFYLKEDEKFGKSYQIEFKVKIFLRAGARRT